MDTEPRSKLGKRRASLETFNQLPSFVSFEPSLVMQLPERGIRIARCRLVIARRCQVVIQPVDQRTCIGTGEGLHQGGRKFSLVSEFRIPSLAVHQFSHCACHFFLFPLLKVHIWLTNRYIVYEQPKS
jgi:hypothetical protein